MAIAFNLASALAHPEDAERSGRYLLEDIEKRGYHLSTGFIGTKSLMQALSEIGRNDVAFRLLHNDSFPSWGFSIKQGATSIWERWDGWTPEKGFQDPGMNSFAHYSFGAVYSWIAKTIGGINLAAPTKGLVIRPRLDPNLTWARTSYRSPFGTIATSWKRDGDHLDLEVTIPANLSALVFLPADAKDITEGGRPIADAEGVAARPPAGGGNPLGLPFRVQSGTYRFRMRLR
jgi:alpha-L-rhamnosidase